MRILLIILAVTTININSWGAENPQRTYKLFEQPILITSAGQSAEGFMVRTICRRLGIDARFSPAANADSLMDARTVLFVAGGSSKGLGAAKVNEDDEMDRIKSITKAANKGKLRIATFHIGGKARRGALSDGFNKLAADGAELIVVKQPGDEDSFFNKIADENKAHYIAIKQQAELMNVLKEMFIEEIIEEVKE